MSLGNRGKAAEAAVKAQLKLLESVTCTHHRFPDARAGSFVPAPCDFMVLNKGRLTLLEVKSILHGCRLPVKNISPDQIARMRMWQAAGAAAKVLIRFDLSPVKAQWQVMPIDFFLGQQTGSWVFDPSSYMTLPNAIHEALYADCSK